MQGDCTGVSIENLPSLGTTPLAPLRPGQCVLLAQEDMLPLYTPDIWLDNLYLRVYIPEGLTRFDHYYVTLISVPALTGTPRDGTATRYMTRMTFQGDNKGHTVGVYADASVYIEGMHTLSIPRHGRPF